MRKKLFGKRTFETFVPKIMENDGKSSTVFDSPIFVAASSRSPFEQENLPSEVNPGTPVPVEEAWNVFKTTTQTQRKTNLCTFCLCFFPHLSGEGC